MDLGTKIKKVRELRNFTQEHMARELGITQESYSRIESNKSPITIERLMKISEVLKTDMMELLKFDEKVIFQNIVNHQQANNNFIQHHNEVTKEFYERIIQELKDEIIFLRGLLQDKK
jgi:transcriptional regulator with XRE-family HTH domain